MNTLGQDDPSGTMSAWAEMVAASSEWIRAKEAVIAAYNDGLLTPQTAANVVGRIMDEAGLGGDAMLSMIPEQYRGMLSPEDRRRLTQGLSAYMSASLLSDIGTGKPMPLVAAAGGGVWVERHEVEGAEVVTIQALITPLQNPETVIAELIETCYRVYPAEVFHRSANEVRDAEWWRRRQAGKSYTEIARSDPRSGLPPEALAFPKEYAPETRRAADRVRRGVERIQKRWTRKVGLPSA